MSVLSLIKGKTNKNGESAFLNNRAPIRTIPKELIGLAKIRTSRSHAFIEMGEGKTIMFCHGLFGGIYNIDKVATALSKKYRFIMPFLPMYDLPLKDCRVKCLGNYLDTFIDDLELDEVVLIGNSMGGGAAAYLASTQTTVLKGLVLCGSSGLSNIPLSNGFFKRKNFPFVYSATQDIFFDRSVPPGEMVRDIFRAIQDTELVIRSIRLTKSAVKEKMEEELPVIETPTLLIWGKEDPVTPVHVAPLFLKLIKNSTLHILDGCGHVPTQEKPEAFIQLLDSFLHKINY
jgi:2-hydroxy-6-oxonona-2,4-dienedioate hydrolase